jgi:formylglycine-generating enzyme required for sulfatase activity
MRKTTLVLLGLGLFLSACKKGKAAPSADDHPPGTQGGPMVKVAAGEFTMGCSSAKARCGGADQPERTIGLDAFFIDKHEVTVADYQACVKATQCAPPHFDDGACVVYGAGTNKTGVLPPTSRGAEQPVVCVSWAEAEAYCAFAGKRLPTDAEWEKSARGTDGRAFPWGNDEPTCDRAVLSVDTPGCGERRSWPVGSKPKGASPYGALDMLGNVGEWTADWYEPGLSPETKNPKGPSSGRERVVRVANFSTARGDARVTSRVAQSPDSRTELIGFRCAK